MGTGPESHHETGFPAEEFHHLTLLFRPYCSIDERKGDLAISECLDILPLEIQRHRPEDDVHRFDDLENVFGEVYVPILTVALANAQGEVAYTLTVPPNIDIPLVAFQAVVLDGLDSVKSNPVQKVKP